MPNSIELEQLPLGRHSKNKTGLTHGFIKGKQGSYDVLHVLGTGSTSKVKLLKDRKTGIKRALKIIYPQGYLSDEVAKISYENEFNILNKLGKVDPVEIKTVSKKTGINKYQIVMDLAEGHELWQLINQKPWLLPRNSRQLMEIGLAILLDLFKVHQQGILLIDDKTENIFVGQDLNHPGKYKVTRIDYGFAKDGYDFEQDSGFRIHFRGTPQVSAPEVLNSCGSDHKGFVTFCKATEIYTVGKVLNELLMNKNSSVPYLYSSIMLLILQMTSPKSKDRPSLEKAIEVFEEALLLEKGSSISNMKEKKPQESHLKSVGQTFSSHASINKFLENKLKEQKPYLKPDAFNQAYSEYKKDKNKYFGIRWLLANHSTIETISELASNNDKNIQYQKAKDFISKNPYSRFAKKLAYASEDTELMKIIHDAPSRWHL